MNNNQDSKVNPTDNVDQLTPRMWTLAELEEVMDVVEAMRVFYAQCVSGVGANVDRSDPSVCSRNTEEELDGDRGPTTNDNAARPSEQPMPPSDDQRLAPAPFGPFPPDEEFNIDQIDVTVTPDSPDQRSQANRPQPPGELTSNGQYAISTFHQHLCDRFIAQLQMEDYQDEGFGRGYGLWTMDEWSDGLGPKLRRSASLDNIKTSTLPDGPPMSPLPMGKLPTSDSGMSLSGAPEAKRSETYHDDRPKTPKCPALSVTTPDPNVDLTDRVVWCSKCKRRRRPQPPMGREHGKGDRGGGVKRRSVCRARSGMSAGE